MRPPTPPPPPTLSPTDGDGPSASSPAGGGGTGAGGVESLRRQFTLSSATSSPAAAKCTPCVQYLKSALLGGGGGGSTVAAAGRATPLSLLEAMGATATLVESGGHHRGAGTLGGGIVEGEEGASVVVTIPGRRVRRLAAMEEVSPPPSVREEIGRRATEAADLLADGLRGAASEAAAAAAPAPVATSARSDHPDLENHLGRPLSVSVHCRPCSSAGPEAGARAYVRGPSPLSVVLCSNRLRTPSDVSEVLVHELIHVYDVHVRGLDLRDCRQLAYSEVRAAREAECAASVGGGVGASAAAAGGFLNEFTRRMCIRSRAGVATCNMFPDRGRGCVAEVLESASRDRAPFGEGDHHRFDGTGFGGVSGMGRREGGSSGGGVGGFSSDDDDDAGRGHIFGRAFSSTYPSSQGGGGGGGAQ